MDNLLESSGDSIDIVYMADDYCSQLAPMFSPAMFREFVVPYLRASADRVHAHNEKFLLHCCGAVRPLLPMILDAGVDMLEPIQIRAAGMDPAELKRDFGPAPLLLRRRGPAADPVHAARRRTSRTK